MDRSRTPARFGLDSGAARSAQTVATWQDGLIAVGWDASKRELTWRSTRFGPVAEGGGLL